MKNNKHFKMYNLDLNDLIDGSFFSENYYNSPFSEFNKENFVNEEDYELISEEKNGLYLVNSPHLDPEVKNEIDTNLNKEKIPTPTSKLNLPINAITKNTSENTILPSKPIISKAKEFEINQAKKSQKGRKKMNQPYNTEDAHTKYKTDNIMTKIKRNLNDNFFNNFNLNLSKSKNPNLNKIELKKIDTSVITVTKKEENLKLLDQKVKDILSNKITRKILSLEKDYNKKKIEFILQQNDEEINYQLNLTNREILDIYGNNKKDSPIFKNFKTLEDDLEILKTIHDDNYLKLYEYTVKNFESIINAILPRRRKKKQLMEK